MKPGSNSFADFNKSTLISLAKAYGMDADTTTQGIPISTEAMGADKWRKFQIEINELKQKWADYIGRAIFSNYETHVKMLKSMGFKPQVFDNTNLSQWLNGIEVLVDEDVPNDKIILASKKEFAIWKKLKNNQWITPDTDIEKLAAILARQEDLNL